MGISDRGTKAKSITSCDNAFVTNILLPQAAHRTPPGSFALCESEATSTIVLSARKRSVSGKALSRNGNQPHVILMSLFFQFSLSMFPAYDQVLNIWRLSVAY
ncbi:hypothetical protein ACQKNB_05655 [Lysinibacillus xylanilyticus]|uniref:hypothetical protein n=1 Tax=Lysinibacillus xylanilyticus TaxID=582475 RepID=UPI003CFE30B3